MDRMVGYLYGPNGQMVGPVYAVPVSAPSEIVAVVGNTTTPTTTTTTSPEDGMCDQTLTETLAASYVIGISYVIAFLLFFFGMTVCLLATRDSRNRSKRRLVIRRNSGEDDWVKTFYSQRLMEDDMMGTGSSSRSTSESSGDVINDASSDELGFWLPVFWIWKTEEIERRCGKTAAQYLRFQELVVCFVAIITLAATLVVLPVNLRGHMYMTRSNFGRTTLNNISPGSSLVWIHVTFSIFLMPLALYFVGKFGKRFRGYTAPFVATKTLMFNNLRTEKATQEKVRQHFAVGHPDDPVENIQLSFKASKLIALDEELQMCRACLMYYSKVQRPGDDRPVYMADNLFIRCCCCCCEVGVDAIEHYSARSLELENKIERIVEAPRKLNRTFFATFETDAAAENVYSHYKYFWKAFFSPRTAVSGDLGTKFWTAKYAPFPQFINWENLDTDGWRWLLRAVVLNLILIIFLFFVTSPVVLLNIVGLGNFGQSFPLLNQIIPALLLLELGLIITGLTKLVIRKTRYHDKISEKLVKMRVTYGYGLIALLILPTFGLTSAKALFDYFRVSATSSDFKWECIFLPDHGMIFVTYFISQALFGASNTFSRILDLQKRSVMRCAAPSNAEAHLRTTKRDSFGFARVYSSNMVQVAIMVVFAFVVPYLTIYGLFYLLMNQIAERYEIFFIYRKKEDPNRLHKTATNLFLFSVLLELFGMLFFLGIRNGSKGMIALAIFAFIFTFLVILVAWTGTLGNISSLPVVGSTLAGLNEDDKDGYDPVAEPTDYEAPVLQKYEMMHPLANRSRRNSASVADEMS